MDGLFSTVITAITAFAATNLDDILILMLFFSQLNSMFRARHIVAGQYLGFAAIILLSLPGFFGGLILPKPWIGLLGLLPIAIGIQQWHHQASQQSAQPPVASPADYQPEVDVQTVADSAPTSIPWLIPLTSLLPAKTYHVAAVTFANGGDNIGIYVPLFASSTLFSLSITLAIFLLLISVWCFIAYQLTRHPLIAQTLTRSAHRFIPFILIGLGVYILVENKTYQLVGVGGWGLGDG